MNFGNRHIYIIIKSEKSAENLMIQVANLWETSVLKEIYIYVCGSGVGVI